MSEVSDIDKIRYWMEHYGKAGIPDQRAVQDFIDCESKEVFSPFRAQLYAIASGKCTEELLNRVVGQSRKIKHGSYEEWGRLMLLWVSGYYRGS